MKHQRVGPQRFMILNGGDELLQERYLLTLKCAGALIEREVDTNLADGDNSARVLQETCLQLLDSLESLFSIPLTRHIRVSPESQPHRRVGGSGAGQPTAPADSYRQLCPVGWRWAPARRMSDGETPNRWID